MTCTGICRIFATLRAKLVPYMEGSFYIAVYSYFPYKEQLKLYSCVATILQSSVCPTLALAAGWNAMQYC